MAAHWGAGHTGRGSHLITLAPDVGDLSKESLNRTITLIADAKSLKQGVAQRLTRGQVEMTQVIPHRLGRRKLVDDQANAELTRLTDDGDRARVIRAPLRPVRTLGGSARADSEESARLAAGGGGAGLVPSM